MVGVVVKIALTGKTAEAFKKWVAESGEARSTDPAEELAVGVRDDLISFSGPFLGINETEATKEIEVTVLRRFDDEAQS